MTKELIMIDKEANLLDAIKLMEKHDISRLVVKDEGKIIGIITERDLSNRLGSWQERKAAIAHIHVSELYVKDLITIHEDSDLSEAAELMLRYGISSLLVKNDGIKGIITKTDLIKALIDSEEKVKDHMSKLPITVEPSSRLLHARRLMIQHGKKRLPVMFKDKLIGILTEGDVARALGHFRKVAEGKQWDTLMKKLKVESFMSKNPITVSPADSLGYVVKLMLKHGISGLPVVENGKLVGIITKTDLVKAVSKIFKPFR